MRAIQALFGLFFGLMSGPALAATITVTTGSDIIANDGQCSLREAILNAENADQSGSVDCAAGSVAANSIGFAPGLIGTTILLDGLSLPSISRDLEIIGPVFGDASGITIDAGGLSRILDIAAVGDLIVSGMTLTGGLTTGPSASGGAVRIINAGSVSFDRVRLFGNQVDSPNGHGGAVYAENAFVSFSGSELNDNQSAGWGGAISAEGSTILVDSSSITGNVSTQAGGGLNASDSTVTINRSTVSGNQVLSDAGGGLNVAAGSSLQMTNSTVSGNNGWTTGGGLMIDSSQATIRHSTFAFNSSFGQAQAIRIEGSASMTADLVLKGVLLVQAGAFDFVCQASDSFASISSSNSLSTDTGCTGVATPASEINLGPLADNGGPTLTHLLQPGSQALNAGGNCANDLGINVDQRGEPRPGLDTDFCDIGALEVQGEPIAIDLELALTADPIAAEQGQPINLAVVLDNLGPDDASGVEVAIDLPAGIDFVQAVTADGSYDEVAGVWSVGTLAAAASPVELTIEATINDQGHYLVTANASADQFDIEPGNNEASVELTLLPPQAPSIVNTLLDVVAEDGLCSLREAIININNGNQSGSLDCNAGLVIQFHPDLIGQTLVLSQGALPIITRDMHIEGPLSGDPAGIAIDADGQSRALEISGAVDVELSNLSLTGGLIQGGGGGVRITGGAEVTMTRVQVFGNANQGSFRGTGIEVSDSSLALIDSFVHANQTLGTSAQGGGVAATSSSLMLSGTTVSNNFSSSNGGGLFLDNNSVLTMTNSTVSGNHAGTFAGGIYLRGSQAILTHSTVAFNTADTNVKAIMVNALPGPSAMTLNNSLVIQADADAIACSAFGTMFEYLGSGSLSTHAFCTGEATPPAAINIGPLSDNGGPTLTHALNFGSVAINAAGDCLADHGIGLDQRGLPRPGQDSSACDIGAYEVQGLPTGPMRVNTLDDVVAEDGLCSLREAIINANNNDQSGSVHCPAGSGDGDFIFFDEALIGGSIVLSGSALPTVTGDLEIVGPVAGDPSGISIDGDGLSRLLHIDGAISVQVQDLSLTGGSAPSGGALRVENGAEATLTGTLFSGNSTTGTNSQGGAIAVIDAGLVLVDSELIDNQAPGTTSFGGGLYAFNSSIAVHASTIADNLASLFGGGIAVTGGIVELVNSTLSDNTAFASGGGLYIRNSEALVLHSTLAGNTGGTQNLSIYVDGDSHLSPAVLNLHNSLVVGIEDSHTTCSIEGNFSELIQSGSLSTHDSCTGTATPSTEILLGALAEHGGPTRTHDLLTGSAAIGAAGDCVADFDIAVDQRGQPRPGSVSTTCDSGAFESQQLPDRIFSDRFGAE